jgi:hypothetical protein
LGYKVPGHLWYEEGWGYKNYDDLVALNDAYIGLFRTLAEKIKDPGYSAAVYTQLSDIEGESNGLMSYDREVIKINPAYGSIHQGVLPSNYLPPQFDDIPNDFLNALSIKLADLPKGTKVYFTLDGTEPSAKSAPYQDAIVIKATTTIKLLGVLANGTKCPVQTRTFKKVDGGDVVKAVPLPAKVEPGVDAAHIKLWDRKWKVADLAAEKPERMSKLDHFTLEFPHPDWGFGVIYKGYITVPTRGIYVFSLTSAEGSSLMIGDKIVVSNEEMQNMWEARGQIALEAGSHPITVSYYHSASWDQGLRVRYMGPGIRSTEVSKTVLSCEAKK